MASRGREVHCRLPYGSCTVSERLMKALALKCHHLFPKSLRVFQREGVGQRSSGFCSCVRRPAQASCLSHVTAKNTEQHTVGAQLFVDLI